MSTQVYLLSCLICLSELIADSDLWFVRLPVNYENLKNLNISRLSVCLSVYLSFIRPSVCLNPGAQYAVVSFSIVIVTLKPYANYLINLQWAPLLFHWRNVKVFS